MPERSARKRLATMVNACVVVGVGGIVISSLSMLDPHYAVRTQGATISSRLQWARQKRQQGLALTAGERLLLEQAEREDERPE